jgi:predicted transposase YdaD
VEGEEEGREEGREEGTQKTLNKVAQRKKFNKWKCSTSMTNLSLRILILLD